MALGYKQTTKEELINNYQKLIKELGHEPTALEIDRCSYLPTSRQIQRRFGGLRQLRQEMGLKNIDFTSGQFRSEVARQATQRSKEDEVHYFNLLSKKYHDPDNDVWVSFQYGYHQAPTPDTYHFLRCDVCIEDRPNNHRTLIDFFSAKDEQSASGSIRIKANKLAKDPPAFLYPHPTFEVVFVCLNPNLNTSRFPKNLPDYITFMTLDEFTTHFLG